MRKLASVQRVLEKKSIVGADLVEAYRVNGWWIVRKLITILISKNYGKKRNEPILS